MQSTPFPFVTQCTIPAARSEYRRRVGGRGGGSGASLSELLFLPLFLSVYSETWETSNVIYDRCDRLNAERAQNEELCSDCSVLFKDKKYKRARANFSLASKMGCHVHGMARMNKCMGIGIVNRSIEFCLILCFRSRTFILVVPQTPARSNRNMPPGIPELLCSKMQNS